MMDSTDKASRGEKIKALKDQENAKLAAFDEEKFNAVR